MNKILELNGYKYSREEFEGYTNRAVFRISISKDFREDTLVNIYTNCQIKRYCINTLKEITQHKATSCEMEHWTTKEQDDRNSELIEETLKDI